MISRNGTLSRRAFIGSCAAVASSVSLFAAEPPKRFQQIGFIKPIQKLPYGEIADAVSDALVRIQVDSGVPIIHAVLLFENEEQANARCFGGEHNRGIEAARAAVEMAEVMRQVRKAV